MTDRELFLLYLNDKLVSNKVMCFVYENFNKLSDLNFIETELKKVVQEKNYLLIKNAILNKKYENAEQNLKKCGVKALFYGDLDYPNALKNIDDFPIILYYKGNLKLLNEKSIAIVGTRKPTIYGRETTRYFASTLSKAGLVTVSGLAYGLDMEVAESSLKVKGKTIAVLGGGLDKIYPAQNTNLANQIVENDGLLLSLYPPFHEPTKYSFLERNRIISGLSLGTIIIEAGESSGTLNTANHAIEQGRELFVVPANINSVASKGSNKLIEDMPDTFTISPERVLKVLKIEPIINNNDKEKNVELSADMKKIVELLYEGEKDFETLLIQTKLDSKTLISLLTIMEINGLIKKLAGNFYSL